MRQNITLTIKLGDFLSLVKWTCQNETDTVSQDGERRKKRATGKQYETGEFRVWEQNKKLTHLTRRRARRTPCSRRQRDMDSEE